MTDRELMQHMLEVLNRNDYPGWQLNIPIVIALRERLAQPDSMSACPHGVPHRWLCEICDQSQRQPLTDEQERKHFEYWCSTNAFDYESNPIGSRECGLQWEAWKARAAHGIKGGA